MPDTAPLGQSPYTLQGRELSHEWQMQLWKDDQKPESRARILHCQGLRRFTIGVQLAPSWVQRFPEAAGWVTKKLPLRRTLERDVEAQVVAVEPSFDRKATGFLDRDRDYAEEAENYYEEWRRGPHGPPVKHAAKKLVEEGEFAGVVIPSDVDWTGCADFYEYLDDAAYDALDDEKKAEYARDEYDRHGQRYARRDSKGRLRPSDPWRRDQYGKAREKEKPFSLDADKSREAHQEAVQRYLLEQDLSASRIKLIPALDCAPAFTRGSGKNQRELHHLTTRELFYPEELPAELNWRGMGDVALIPQGYDPSSPVGRNGQFYLYTTYYTWTDPKTKIKHPLIIFSVGGNPTWWSDSQDEGPVNASVAVIDLYKTHTLQGNHYWSYFGGCATGDDDADYAWEPYMWPIAGEITHLEGFDTSIAAATAVGAFTGWFNKPDARLVELDGESLADTATGQLIQQEMPLPGEMKTTVSDVFQASPTQVSPDAWRVRESSRQDLLEATAIDQPQGRAASGNAQLVKNSLAQTAKIDIRDGLRAFVEFCGEADARIRTAIAGPKFGVCWPIEVTMERPVGSEIREGVDILAFNPAWFDGKAGKQFRMLAPYPSEQNPIAIDQATQAYIQGVGTLEELCKEKGIKDTMSYRAQLMEDRLWNDPATTEVLKTRVARRSGNALMLEVQKLQQSQEMTKQGLPGGFEAGVPTAALNRPGGGGGQTTAGQMRAGAKGGVMAAQQLGAQQQMAAQGQMAGAA